MLEPEISLLNRDEKEVKKEFKLKIHLILSLKVRNRQKEVKNLYNLTSELAQNCLKFITLNNEI